MREDAFLRLGEPCHINLFALGTLYTTVKSYAQLL